MESVVEHNHEGTLTIQSFLMGNFFYKAHNYAWLMFDMRKPEQSDREGTE
jgi:predicted ferric reductase